ncbi:MTAP family purine nucleoside phosphorylase [Ramlibacter sp. AW1]|uniref:Purine nucleoside phosphorylase n=1 Tax=Ramlibacter aurantiacus TaxID=2801330 RepID=A0A937D1F6_9BURK|nr:MTAP family purine nucleoside phosphorylase [Ramlibacter aurantiacus]MBL0418730.1 MTAP family purine nucleoside phosphorylase [Ramlibacter aurantiacus]
MLAIIGGTGFYDLDGLRLDERIAGATPFGEPSGEILRGSLHGQPLLFLARHGSGHRLLPHEVNYRANIFALKRAGATQLLGFSAVGSLALDTPPGALAMPGQYVDWTRGQRERTFFGRGVAAHVSTARPVSAPLVEAVCAAGRRAGLPVQRGLTYACVEGPRLGTQAESHLLRQLGCHLVGMTNVPEVFLAREAQMAYATVGLVTDYDCWLDDPAQHVSVGAIFERYRQTLADARRLLDALLQEPLPEPEPESRQALAQALLTPDTALSPEQRSWLEVLRR